MSSESVRVQVINDLIPWAIKLMNVKDYKKLSSHLRDQDQVEGTFKVSTFCQDKSSWGSFDFYPEIPEIVGHYLRLNLSFVEPLIEPNLTYNQDWTVSVLQQMKDQRIDYILDPVFLSQQIFDPQITTLSTAIFGIFKISVLTKKEFVKKTSFEEISVFEKEVWWSLISIILITAFSITILTSKSRSISSTCFSLSILLISQTLSHRLTKNWILFSYIIICLFMTAFYKAIILDHIMHEPQEWCQTLDCFAKSSKIALIASDNVVYETLKNYHDESSSAILRKAVLHPRFEFGPDSIVDMLYGRADFYFDSHFNNQLLGVNKWSSRKDLLVLTAMSNFTLQVGLIRKSHPKSDQIIRKINECSEFGIVDKWVDRTTSMLGFNTIVLFKKIFEDDDEILGKLEDVFDHEKENISLDDYKNTFKTIIFGSMISILLFFFEIISNIV